MFDPWICSYGHYSRHVKLLSHYCYW